MPSPVAGRARTMWCMRLHSALRTALSCAIVGGATLYGPKILTREIKFTAFSYLTAVLIVSDAALGDSLKGCWHALCATVQVVPVAMLVRWLIAPGVGVPLGMAAVGVAVAAAAFLVAVPECTDMTAKRIAFGQIVLVCSDAVVSDGGGEGFMRPVGVAASTGLGAVAAVVAVVVPYPDLAYYKVRRLCRIYAENASERLNLYLRAFKVEDNHTKMELISQAKPLAETGNKLLYSIRIFQEGMKWERPWSRYLNTNLVGRGDRLQSMELPMRGIEYSLASSPVFPVQIVDKEHLTDVLHDVTSQLGQKIEHVKHFSPFDSKTEPQKEVEFKEKPLLPLEPISHKQEWIYFFFSCIDMLLNDANLDLQNQHQKTEFDIIKTLKNWVVKLNKRLEFAFKCSLSLGLAMLLGLIFDKENGCWAGLTIAISFVTDRQAVFTIANTRAQGTAIGSVYGVLCCFLFHYEELRLTALLPWIIFTSFLRHSRMYGQTGGVSASIGALLILGRKNYGLPNEFAIARLAEIFIGLSSFIIVGLFLQPTRAATLAKNHLHVTLCSLQDCINETRFYLPAEKGDIFKFLKFKDKQRNLKSQVCELKKFVEDAEMEPNFWYLPFRTSCYEKLVRSLSTIADMMNFLSYNFEVLQELSETKDTAEQINGEFELLKEELSSSLRILDNAYKKEARDDSQGAIDGKLKDLEAGKLENREQLSANLMIEDREKQRNTEQSDEDKKRLGEKIAQCLGAIGFCISSLSKEIIEIKICIKEIERGENQFK